MSTVSIADVVNHWIAEGAPPEALVLRLVAREDALCDVLRLAAAQFGMYPQIVSEVLAEAQMGSPIPNDVRAMIRGQFVALMEDLQRQAEGNN